MRRVKKKMAEFLKIHAEKLALFYTHLKYISVDSTLWNISAWKYAVTRLL